MSYLLPREFRLTRERNLYVNPAVEDQCKFEGDVVIPADIPEHAVIRQFLKTKRQFYRHTRLLPEEFFLILSELQSTLKSNSKRPAKRRRTQSDEAKSEKSLHSADELFLWAYQSESDGCADDLMTILFGNITKSTLDGIVDRVTTVINKVYADQLEWPDAEEREASYGQFSVDANAVALLDRTHCQIRVPTYDEDGYFSGYKAGHTQTYFVWLNAMGFILRVEGPKSYPIVVSDWRHFTQSNMMEHEENLLSEGEVVIAESRFLGDPAIVVPPTLKDVNDLASAGLSISNMMDYAKEIGRDRAFLEKIIDVVKCRAQSLFNRFKRTKPKQHSLVLAACRVTNRIRLERVSKVVM